jgi:diguanylate cyclase (GGDEF)-like protein
VARWFTIGLGIAGWIGLGLPMLLGVEGEIGGEPASAAWTALFFVVILASRALAFHPMKGSVLSLDSAFCAAAVLCVGPFEAGRLTAVALTSDAAARLIRARGRAPEPSRWLDDLGYVLYFGGMSGGLVMSCGLVFGARPIAPGAVEPAEVAVRVVGIGAALLASHYAIQGARLRLLGRSWRAYLAEQALPGIAAEASLLPISIVLVLLYDPRRPLPFVLLSLTYLLIDLVFSRLSRTRKQLEARVHELETLNATARQLSASLELEELVETVARETCKAIPEAEAVALVHRRAGEGGFVLDGFDRTTERFFRQELAEGEGAAGWVMSRGLARRIDDLAHDADVAVASTQGIRSWLGVPLFIYGRCEGVIAVQSARRAAFRADHQRLLESLALQIAAALQNAQLYELAMVDGLTGLFVRRYFDARIDEEIERSKRYGTPFSVVMMDVDDFKKLNDQHGHLIGDRVLRAIATTVKSQMRGVDTAARYGGEEIAVILPRTDMLSAYNVGERICAAVAEQRVTTDSEPPKVLGVTASFGIASYPESGARAGEDLVRRADRALYRAKQLGKNRVELFWGDEAAPAAPSPDVGKGAGNGAGADPEEPASARLRPVPSPESRRRSIP